MKEINKDKKFKIWINACEVSGDLQASLLLKSLKIEYPNLEAVGMGGEKLAEEGQKNYFHIKELSVMGVTEIFSALPRIFKLWRQIKEKIQEEKPDAIMLVDSGEFNLPIAKFAKSINLPVYYFIPPKVWAWRKGRIKTLKKYVNTILCILPFEVDFYKKNNIEVKYIQNPLVNALSPYKSQDLLEKNEFKIALLPGSRKNEVSRLLPLFAKTAKEIHKKYPQYTFSIIKAPNFTIDYLSSFWNSVENTPAVEYILSENRYDFLSSCKFCIAASGTATLETAILNLPTIICYKVSTFSYLVAKALVDMKVGLPNLILNNEVFPEFLQSNANVENILKEISLWIEDENKVKEILTELDRLNNIIIVKNNELNIFDSLL